MIKWCLYLKSLKQYLFILLISCFTFWVNCFVNWFVVEKIWNYSESPFQSNIQTEVISKGSFLSQRLWTTKPFFTWISQNNKRAYLWWKNWLPYFYEYFNSYSDYWLSWVWFNQGFVDRYFVCSELNENSTWITNCSQVEVWDWTVNELKYFLWKVYSSDYYWYDLVNYYQHYVFPYLCISSHEVWLSVCFEGWRYWWWNSTTQLTWSYWIASNIDFQNIDSIYYDYNSPAISSNIGWGWTIGWWGWTSVSFSSWWNITFDCVRNRALTYYENNWYSERLCYWWLDSFTTSTWGWLIPLAWNWLNVFDIYSWTKTIGALWNSTNYANINAWFTYWRLIYKQHKVWYDAENWYNWFNNVPIVLLTYYWFVDTYWFDYSDDSILDYCDLKINWNLFNNYDWVNKSLICSSVSPWDDYSVWDNILVWNDILNQGSWTKVYNNWSVFIDDIINKVKSYWRIPNKSDFWMGYLPQYILTFLCLIILFRFISH